MTLLSADIKLLIDTFYAKVQSDDMLGYVFNDVAKVDWPRHLPVMYAFWEFLLLDQADAYRGNPIQKHFDLHQKHALKAEYFDRWVALSRLGRQLFAGPKAGRIPSSGPSPSPLPGSRNSTDRLRYKGLIRVFEEASI